MKGQEGFPMTPNGPEQSGDSDVWVDRERARAVGKRVRERDFVERGLGVMIAGRPPLDDVPLIDYYFFLDSVLFDFRGFDMVVDGEDLHGADAFFTLARRQVEHDPHFFTAERLAGIRAQEFLAAFSLTGRPEESTLRRGEERAALLRDAARRLLAGFEGHAAHLLARTEGYLRRADGAGLMDILQEFAGYQDPHFKKGFMLVKSLESLGLYRVVDRENLFVPVDYHLMRVALRSGMVRVGPELAEWLRERRPAMPAQDERIRAAVKQAFKTVEETSAMDIFVMDELFWTLGRSCCHYARSPRCHACDFTECTVMRSFDYPCPGQCPLSGVCGGSTDAGLASLFETNVETVYY